MNNRDLFMAKLVSIGKDVVTKSEIKKICSEMGISGAQWFTKDESNRVGRGLYKVPGVTAKSMPEPVTIDMQAQVLKMPSEKISHGNRISNVVTDLETENLVPAVYKNYVPFGNFDDLLSIIASKKF